MVLHLNLTSGRPDLSQSPSQALGPNAEAASRPTGRVSIAHLRGQLLQARRHNDHALLGEVEEGLYNLVGRRYRCCLIDYEKCAPIAYVRLIRYDHPRIKVQVEYPIQVDLAKVQWVPLSHLADYDEVESAVEIQRIYAGLADYIRKKNPHPASTAGPAAEEASPQTAKAAFSPGAEPVLALFERFVFRRQFCSPIDHTNGQLRLCAMIWAIGGD